MIDLTKYADYANEYKTKFAVITQDVSDNADNVIQSKLQLEAVVEAADAMNTVALSVQQQFTGVMESLVTQSLQYIYGDNYSFTIESKIARGQPEMHMYLVIDGEKYSPRDNEVSGGQLDIIAFASRVIRWALQTDRSRPTIILDEPFKYLGSSSDLYIGAIEQMLSSISKMLGLQFIIVTNNTKLALKDAIRYHVTLHNGVSSVEKVTILPKDKTEL